MNRRDVLRGMLVTGGLGSLGFRISWANADDYRGKLLVNVQADGGWDPTSFCDPKTNQPKEPIINHWAEHADPDEAGNILYAPFANNKEFFDKHQDKILVINGVDAQTNSHTAGIVHNWSGRISEGFPSATALWAGNAPEDLPLPYLGFGGYSESAGVVRPTRMSGPDLLRNIASPELNEREVAHFSETQWELLERYRAEKAASLALESNLLWTAARNRRDFAASMGSAADLAVFTDAIPADEDLQQPEYRYPPRPYPRSELRMQAQLAVLAFKTGVAVSADLWLGGFDTHGNHDEGQGWLLGNLTDSVAYLWNYAEENGVADRMVVVLGSDFGRTNFYNADQGKDHWPIGSFVIMEKNQPWTNRVVGETDERHFAYNIDPATLEHVGDSDPKGTHIYPKHVHKALRRYLGIENSPGAQRFPLNNTEDFAFFG